MYLFWEYINLNLEYEYYNNLIKLNLTFSLVFYSDLDELFLNCCTSLRENKQNTAPLEK